MFFSEFAPFGMLDFSGDESEGEKIYKSMVAGFTDPRDGRQAIDMTPSPENYEEAKIYAIAMAIAAARVTLRRAHAQLRPETAYEQLAAHEDRYVVVPGANDTVVDRRAALVARERLSRGPRIDAVQTGLQAILGARFLAYRTITADEAALWPSSPGDGPGLFPRFDVPARRVRLLAPVGYAGSSLAASHDDGFVDTTRPIGGDSGGTTYVAAAQTFSVSTANQRIVQAKFTLSKTGAPTGSAYAKLYAIESTTGFPTGAPIATSEPLDVAGLTGVGALKTFTFRGAERARVELGTTYAIAVEYSGGSTGNTVAVGSDDLLQDPSGEGYFYESAPAAGWQSIGVDVPFEVVTATDARLPYENWSPADAEVLLRVGDELAVEIENLGLAEKVEVLSVDGTGSGRHFSAIFESVHDYGASATTGPAPIWTSTKRFVLVVVDAVAAIDADLVRKVDTFMSRISRTVTQWAIVQPTSPGASTIGPFTLDSSPLGVVTLGSLSF